MLVLHVQRQRHDPAVDSVLPKRRGDFAQAIVENNLQASTVWQIYAIAQLPLGAKSIQHARNHTGVLPELGGLALEAVDLFEHFDWDDDRIIFEI
jgi:hypothetical protein